MAYGLDEISEYTGLVGVTRDNILRDIRRQGVDPLSDIDWESIGGSIKDSGARTDETWRVLNREYGLSRPMTAYRARQAYTEYRPVGLEWNAEQLKRDLREHGEFIKVMRAICEGKGTIPSEIEQEFFEERGYTGKDKKEFIETLCSGWPPSTLDRISTRMQDSWTQNERTHISDMYRDLWTQEEKDELSTNYAKCYTGRDMTIGELSECMKETARGLYAQ